MVNNQLLHKRCAQQIHRTQYQKAQHVIKQKKSEPKKFDFSINMVPKVRIELTADPYQGPVLPLNYIGKHKQILYLAIHL